MFCLKKKKVNMIGNPEQWLRYLDQFDSTAAQALRERVDLQFLGENVLYFNPNDQVKLLLAIKNVKTLLVKVFEINTDLFYRTQNQQVSTNINLDGLVANHQEEYTFDYPPIKRQVHPFEFPKLNRRGLFVIEVQ